MLNLCLSFAVALLCALLLGKPVISKLHELKYGQKILKDGPSWHAAKENTPTMGGVIFVLAIIAGMLVLLPSMIKNGDFKPLLMLALSTVFGIIGFIDDYTKIKKQENKGLSAAQKLLLQIAAAALFITVMRVLGYLDTERLYIPFFKTEIIIPWYIYLILAVFAILGTDNAVNLTDGIDGLCTSVTGIVSLYFALSLFLKNDIGGASFALSCFGGLVGFFIFNRHPAKVFMGDTGSLFLGGAVCAMAFCANDPLILIAVGIIYVAEALSDILQVGYFKLTHGKRIFKMAPLHHHFEKCGWSEWKIVGVFSAVTLVCCALSLVFA